MKSGWRTSEFYLTLATAIVAFALSIGLVTAKDAADLNEAIKQAGVSVGSLVTAAMVIVRYIQGRVEEKKAHALLAVAITNKGTAAIDLRVAQLEEGKK